MSRSQVAAIIPAAGSGERLGAGTPKALVEIQGITLIERAVHNLSKVAETIVIAAPEGYQDNFRQLFSASQPGLNITIVTGGMLRSESVANALQAIPPEINYVLIHDAARAFAPSALAEQIAAELAHGEKAVVPAIAVVDTIKVVDSKNYVLETPDRMSLRAIQTPQGFTRDVIIAAHADGADATDDAALVSKLGIAVKVIAGHPLARKITTIDDLAWARELAEHS